MACNETKTNFFIKFTSNKNPQLKKKKNEMKSRRPNRSNFYLSLVGRYIVTALFYFLLFFYYNNTKTLVLSIINSLNYFDFPRKKLINFFTKNIFLSLIVR